MHKRSFLFMLLTNSLISNPHMVPSNVLPEAKNYVIIFESLLPDNSYTKKSIEAAFSKHILHNPKPVIVKFSMKTCSHCQAMKPPFERLAKEFATTIDCIDIDVETFSIEALSEEIITIPTFAYFNQGKELARLVDIVPLIELRKQAIASFNLQTIVIKCFPSIFK